MVTVGTQPVYGLPTPRVSARYTATILATPGLLAFYPLADPTDAVLADATGRFNGAYTSGGWNHTVGSMIAGLGVAVAAKSGGTPTASITGAVVPSLWSVEEWIRPQSTGNQTLFGMNGGGGAIWTVYNGHWYYWGNNNDVDTGVSPVVGQPTHLVATWDGTTLRTYINGTAYGTRTNPGGPSTTWGIFTSLGAMAAGTVIQACAVYFRALAATDVLAHYHAAGY